MAPAIIRATATGMGNVLEFLHSSARISQYHEGKRSPWYAPEYLLTVCISKEIRCTNNPPFIDLEESVEAVMQDAGGWGSGTIPLDMRPNGKYDIVLSRRQNGPFAVVEVKWAHTFTKSVKADIDRICRTLNRNNGIAYGILALLVSGQSTKSKDLLESRISNFKHRIPTHINSCYRNKKISHHVNRIPPREDGREYAAVTFKISNG